MLKSLITPLLIALCAGSAFYYTTSNQNAQVVNVGPVGLGGATGKIPISQPVPPPPPPLPPAHLPDVDAMIVIDNSGSMFGYKCNSHEKIEANDPDQLRIQGVDLIVGALAADLKPRETSLGIVTFGDDATLVRPLTQLSNDDPSVRSDLAAAIKNPPCQGDTNIAAAIRLAQQELHSKRATPGNIPAIIFLTDGNPTQGGTFDDVRSIIGDLGNVQLFVVILGADPKLGQSKQFWQEQSKEHSNVTYYELTASSGITPLYNLLTGKFNYGDVSGAPALPPGQRVTIPVPANVRQAVMKVIKRTPSIPVTIQDPDSNDPRKLPPERFRALLNNSTVEVYVIERPKQGDWVFSVPDRELITVLQPEYRSIYQVQMLQPDSLGLLSVDQPTNLVVQVVDIDSQKPITGTFTLTAAYRQQDQPERANQPILMTAGPAIHQYNAQIPPGTFTEGQQYILTFMVQDDAGLSSQPSIYKLSSGRLPVIASVVANPLIAYVDQPITLVVQVANPDAATGAPSVNLAPLPGVGGVTFQSQNTTTYNAMVPPLARPGTYVLNIAYRGKTTTGQDFSSASSVTVTVREREQMIWLRNLAFALAVLIGTFLVFRFVLLSPLIPIFQRIGISPSGYIRITPPGSKYANPEIDLRSVLSHKRKLRVLTIGIGPRFDIPLEESPIQDDNPDDETTPPKRPSLRERLWEPKAPAYITCSGGNTMLIIGLGTGSAFGSGVGSRDVKENTIEYSLKSIDNPDDVS